MVQSAWRFSGWLCAYSYHFQYQSSHINFVGALRICMGTGKFQYFSTSFIVSLSILSHILFLGAFQRYSASWNRKILHSGIQIFCTASYTWLASSRALLSAGHISSLAKRNKRRAI